MLYIWAKSSYTNLVCCSLKWQTQTCQLILLFSSSFFWMAQNYHSALVTGQLCGYLSHSKRKQCQFLSSLTKRFSCLFLDHFWKKRFEVIQLVLMMMWWIIKKKKCCIKQERVSSYSATCMMVSLTFNHTTQNWGLFKSWWSKAVSLSVWTQKKVVFFVFDFFNAKV